MKPSISWLFNMAWRDSRRDRGRLVLFSLAVAIGVAALVAIDGFGRVMQEQIDNRAKELLGADLKVQANRTFSDSAQIWLDSMGGFQVEERVFSSMVLFPSNGESRAVQVHALDPGYPMYGSFETDPVEAGAVFRENKQALVDRVTMEQLGLKPGDSVLVGSQKFAIAGALKKVPGRNMVFSNIFAPVYIPLSELDKTQLIKKGSRVELVRYIQLDSQIDPDALVESNKDRFKRWRLRTDTIKEQQQELGNAFKDLTRFLQLVAFVSLLLGGLGVGSAVHVYVKAKVKSVAVLRCLGATGPQAFLIYLIQITSVGFLGALAGSLAGTILQIAIPEVLAGFLPVEIPFSISWPSIGMGVSIGTLLAIMFALPPLVRIRRISPLVAIQAAAGTEKTGADWLGRGMYLLILGMIWGIALWRVGDIVQASIFTAGLLLAIVMLAGVAQTVIWLIRKSFPRKASYLWRQALANLFRPQNQTLILVLSIGLGTWGIALMFQIQHILLREVEITGGSDRPNMVAFDIQKDQVAGLDSIATAEEIDIQQIVPVVTMRLESLKGQSRDQWLADTNRNVSTGALNREYRVTFRDSIIDSEEITKGKWYPTVGENDTIWISVEEEFAKNSLKVDIGDEVIFNLSRVPLKTYVGSFRKVNWERVQTNFIVLFPEGVLEDAPQFIVAVGKSPDALNTANFKDAVVRTLPGISIIDLGLIIETVEAILQQVSFIVRFMAWISILTGLLVLAGSVWNTLAQRRKEAALLRTIGATKYQVQQIQLREYLLLGLLAVITGLGLALAASWALSYFVFSSSFVPEWKSIAVLAIAIPGFTVIIGLLGLRSVVNQSPLAVLRRED